MVDDLDCRPPWSDFIRSEWTQHVGELVDEIDADRACVFWG